jgi:hypothetical protein
MAKKAVVEVMVGSKTKIWRWRMKFSRKIAMLNLRAKSKLSTMVNTHKNSIYSKMNLDRNLLLQGSNNTQGISN